LDGRARGWSRDHAAHWQAGGNSGTLAERARHWREIFRALAIALRQRPHCFRREILERARRLSRGCGRLRSPTGDCRSYISSEPNLRSWRATVTIALARKSAARCRCGRDAFAYAGGSTLARARRAGLCTALPGRLARARCHLPSRHRLAVAHWSIRRGVGPRPRLHIRSKSRSARQIFPANLSTSERGWTRSHLRNLRRRAAAYTARLSLPGMVVRRIAPPRAQRVGVTTRSHTQNSKP